MTESTERLHAAARAYAEARRAAEQGVGEPEAGAEAVLDAWRAATADLASAARASAGLGDGGSR